jgi:hypothetical protein
MAIWRHGDVGRAVHDELQEIGHVTIAPKSFSSEPGSSRSVENFVYQDVAVLETVLPLDDLRVADKKWSPFLPFMSWLISSLRPEVAISLGFEVRSSFHAVWEAARNVEWPSKCTVVLLARSDQSDQVRQAAVRQFNAVVSEPGSRPRGVLEGAVEEDDLIGSGFPPIQLLHLALSENVGRNPEYLQKWVDHMASGAVLVVTTTDSGGSEYLGIRDYIADQIPSTVISLGPSAEIFLAQVPVEDATPLVDFLRNAPPAFRGLFALLAERDAFRHILAPEATSPSALRAFIDSLEESRRLERETFQFALDATRNTMAALASQSGILRDELVEYKEQTRLEKAVMQDEYFGRLDELTAKLSTSAARYTRDLTIRELALEAREREAERLAGEAAEAQRRLAELLGTSSWRITAPLRLLSRLAGPGRAKDQLPRHD